MKPEQTETPPEIDQLSSPPKKVSFLRRKAVLITISVIIFLATAGAAYVLVFAQKNNPTAEAPQSQATTDDKDDTKPLVDTIYAYSDSNLVAINPQTKEFVIIDTAIDAESGNANLGTTTPLTAPNFQSAVYIKDNTGWTTTGSDKKIFYSIPDAAKKTGFYTLYLAAWSSDSTKLAFSIGFMCPMFGSTCSDSSEDKSLTGVYVYDTATEKTTKIQATGVIQWLPGSTKIAYFDESTTPSKLLINDTVTGAMTTAATKKFGFGPQISISHDAQKIIYSAGTNGRESSAIFIENINGTDQKTLKTGSFADLQWPKFLPGSSSDYAYSKRKEIACYGGGSGCVSASLHIVKNGEDKKAVEDIDYKVVGFYKNQAVVVISDGQVGISPNNPAPYKANISLLDLNNFALSKIYEKVTQKGSDTDMQLKLRIGE